MADTFYLSIGFVIVNSVMNINLTKGIALLLYSAVFISCSQEQPVTDYNKWEIREFKRAYFIKCLSVGYVGVPCMDTILDEDVSIVSEYAFAVRTKHTIDSLAQEARKEIMDDSIKLMTRHEWETGKKRVFQICLDNYLDLQLDTLGYKCFK